MLIGIIGYIAFTFGTWTSFFDGKPGPPESIWPTVLFIIWALVTIVLIMMGVGRLLGGVVEGVDELEKAGVFNEIAREARRRSDDDPLGLR
jgi:hypothetical protein